MAGRLPMYKQKGAKNYCFKDHKIINVGRPIKIEELQQILELETENEE